MKAYNQIFPTFSQPTEQTNLTSPARKIQAPKPYFRLCSYTSNPSWYKGEVY